MTPKQFIEKAIEGGFRNNLELNDLRKEIMSKSLAEIFLDPLAWQAVGKVEGWGFKKIFLPSINDKSTYHYDIHGDLNNIKNISILTSGYTEKMHKMIDALCEGKSINQFLETL